MERRSWPWKKKSSSEKATKAAAAAAESLDSALASTESQGEKDNYKKPNYVQISVESYTHLTGLEEQVKSYEDQVQSLDDEIKDLNEKLSAADSEMTTKENLVKQHAKVAEEAVSGWEKAEAEALALKNSLETMTLSKLTVEDRAAHLDGALKECMRQIRNLKEEHEHKLQELVLTKNKQCDKIRLDLEAKIADLDQELLRSAAENAALLRSLQERGNMLVKMSEEKSQAEAEIELLKGNVEACEREINSMKYEVHVVSKELEIRNEEKNMSMRSAEVANKQHMEGVKKIAKLEAECQRLRGLVRKKLPGPAALAQMKLEVESLGRDYGDSRMKRSPVKPSSPHMSPLTEFSIDNSQKFHKETEFLTERLFSMEEETKMLKEALAKRNSELQASRNLCAKTSSRLQSLEAQLHISNQQKSSPKSIIQVVPAEGYSTQNASNPPSITSMSEDGNDDDRSCADSWTASMISEFSHMKKEKGIKAENAKNLELMDDFLEMEKLACLDAPSAVSESPNSKTSEIANGGAPAEVVSISSKDNVIEVQPDMDLSNIEQLPLTKIRSKLSLLLDSVTNETDMRKILEDVKHTIGEEAGQAVDKETVSEMSQDLSTAVSQIHDFVLLLRKEAMAVDDASDCNELTKKIDELSVTINKVLNQGTSLTTFVFDLSHVLDKASELRFSVLGYKGNEAEINSPDCIDKVALPENKIVQDDGPSSSSGESYENGCTTAHVSSPKSNPEVPDDGNLTASCKVSLQEFEELKLEKEKIATDFARCTEDLETTRSQLQETEQLLSEIRSQFDSAQKSNSLAETQLKCMAGSYRSLEVRAEELEAEVKLLRVKTEALENELESEKTRHEDALRRCKDLQEELEKNQSCPVCAAAAAEMENKNKQEKDLAAAAEKLAECQETIFLLGKQLKSLHPHGETTSIISSNGRSQRVEGSAEEEPTTSMQEMMDTDTSPGPQSPAHTYEHPGSPSDAETNQVRSPVSSAKHPKHRSTKSTSSSSSSTLTPEKHKGFSRFFSSKGK
ncbi:Filament-like plant protein 4 [Linum perenne]